MNNKYHFIEHGISIVEVEENKVEENTESRDDWVFETSKHEVKINPFYLTRFKQDRDVRSFVNRNNEIVPSPSSNIVITLVIPKILLGWTTEMSTFLGKKIKCDDDKFISFLAQTVNATEHDDDDKTTLKIEGISE